MALQTLPSVRETLGDEGAEELLRWLDRRIEERAVPRDEYRELLSRLDLLNKDVSLLRDELGQMRGEFRDELGQMRGEFRGELGQMRGEFRGELGQLRLEMNEKFAQVNERFDQMNERFDQMNARSEAHLSQMYDRMLVQTRWLIGSLALIGTVISALLAIGQFVR